MSALVTPGNWNRAAGNDLIARDGAGTLWLYRATAPGDSTPPGSSSVSGWNGYTIA